MSTGQRRWRPALSSLAGHRFLSNDDVPQIVRHAATPLTRASAAEAESSVRVRADVPVSRPNGTTSTPDQGIAGRFTRTAGPCSIRFLVSSPALTPSTRALRSRLHGSDDCAGLVILFWRACFPPTDLSSFDCGEHLSTREVLRAGYPSIRGSATRRAPAFQPGIEFHHAIRSISAGPYSPPFGCA